MHTNVPTHKIVFLPAIFVKAPAMNAVTTVKIPETNDKVVMTAGFSATAEKIIPE